MFYITRTRSCRAAAALLTLLALMAGPMAGCEDLPGGREEQGAVIGGVAGAGIGALIASENRLVGALIGGLLGAGGGYLIGAKTDWFEDDDDEVREEAEEAVANAQRNPATPEQARRANTADINNNGFVTLDEVIAMERAGLTDQQMIARLERTNQIFDLNQDQERILLDEGVSRNVINRMKTINQAERERLLGSANRDDVISRDPDADADMD